MKTWIRWPATLVILGVVTACGGRLTAPPTAEQSEEINLQQIAEMLREYQINHRKPPKTLKDLRINPGSALGGVELIASGDFVVILGVPLPDTKEEPGGSPNNEILAYGKDVPAKGGAVLLLNRTVRRITSDEFKATPQASPGT